MIFLCFSFCGCHFGFLFLLDDDGEAAAADSMLAGALSFKIKISRRKQNKGQQGYVKQFFFKPDPVTASTYYKSAVDAYQTLGDCARLESYYCLSSGDFIFMCGAWASAALYFTCVAELL